MIAAIAADAFGAEEYSTAFWTGIQADYSLVLNAASDTTGDVSRKVAIKNEQKKAIKNVLNGLLLVIRANNPYTYTAVYRDWEWQKENY